MTIPGNFEYRDPAIEKQLNEIGQLLRSACPPGVGFVFLLAHYGEGGGTFYTSNVDRHDVCNLMREFITKNDVA